jgi:hypothetical protein
MLKLFFTPARDCRIRFVGLLALLATPTFAVPAFSILDFGGKADGETNNQVC